MTETDTYLTLAEPSEVILFKEKNSKFFGHAFPVACEDQIKDHLEAVKKQHPGAGHFCYAWQLGTSNIRYRANDDGEPTNSAGMPIYGQIQSFGITDVLVVVARVFGGTKLGVGGLISAYRTTAKLTIEAASIVSKIIPVSFILRFEYPQLNKVMRVIREQQLEIVHQQMDLDCRIEVAGRQSDSGTIKLAFDQLPSVRVDQKTESIL